MTPAASSAGTSEVTLASSAAEQVAEILFLVLPPDLDRSDRDLERASALDGGIGDAGGDQANRANRVVVGWDHDSRRRRVAVRIDHGDHRNTQAPCLVDRQVLALGIDDEDCAGKLGHVPHAAERALQALQLLPLCRRPLALAAGRIRRAACSP